MSFPGEESPRRAVLPEEEQPGARGTEKEPGLPRVPITPGGRAWGFVGIRRRGTPGGLPSAEYAEHKALQV